MQGGVAQACRARRRRHHLKVAAFAAGGSRAARSNAAGLKLLLAWRRAHHDARITRLPSAGARCAPSVRMTECRFALSSCSGADVAWASLTRVHQTQASRLRVLCACYCKQRGGGVSASKPRRCALFRLLRAPPPTHRRERLFVHTVPRQRSGSAQQRAAHAKARMRSHSARLQVRLAPRGVVPRRRQRLRRRVQRVDAHAQRAALRQRRAPCQHTSAVPCARHAASRASVCTSTSRLVYSSPCARASAPAQRASVKSSQAHAHRLPRLKRVQQRHFSRAELQQHLCVCAQTRRRRLRCLRCSAAAHKHAARALPSMAAPSCGSMPG